MYAIIEQNNNRLVAFSNTNINIPECYLVADIETNDSLIGKRYNNGTWEDVPEPISEQDSFKSSYALGLGRV